MKKRQPTFQKKLFLKYSLFLAVVIIVSSTLFAIYSYQNLLHQTKQGLEQLVQKTSNEVDNLFADMDRITLYIVANPYINDTLTDAYFGTVSDFQIQSEISKTLTAISVSNQTSRFRINMYNQKGNFISTGLAYTQTLQEEIFLHKNYADWYSNLPIQKNKPAIDLFRQDYLSSLQQYTISLYREIYSFRNMNRVLGIVEIQCPYDVFQKILSFSDSGLTGYLYDQYGVLVYPILDDLYTKNLYQTYQTNSQGIFEKQLYMSNTSLSTGHTLLITMPNSQNVNLVKSMLFLPLFFALTTFTLGLIVVYMISKKVTQPLQELADSIQNVTLNNLSLNMNSDVHMDEITHLNYAFREMFDRLQHSMEESVKSKEQNIKAHMIALQSQMNPHFLYNVLAIIRAMARAENSTQIVDVSDHLSRLLRYNSDYDTQYTSLQKELEHTAHYLALMKLRYEDMFEYEVQMDSPETHIQIPKLSIQPLVENCFQHGFRKMAPPWKIHIHFWKENDLWFLAVSDNGSGITPEAVAGLYKNVDAFLKNPSDQLASLKIGGMGLVNTIARFKLTYKEHLTFQITQLPQGGTKIILGGIENDEPIISRR